MHAKEREDKLVALVLTMPKHDDFMVKQYQKDPEYALLRAKDELDEYIETNEIQYLLSTLRKIAEAKGWSALSRETGLARSSLYAALSGESDPKIGTVMKILKALGIHLSTKIVPFQGAPKGAASKKT